MISEMQETGFGRKACIINDSGQGVTMKMSVRWTGKQDDWK